MKHLLLLAGVSLVTVACADPSVVQVSEWYVLEEIDGSPLPFGHGVSATAAGRIQFRDNGTCVRQITSLVEGSAGLVEHDHALNCLWSGSGGVVDVVWDDTDPSVPTGSTSAGAIEGARLELPIGYSGEVFWTEVYRRQR